MAQIISTGKQRSAKLSRVLVGAQALTFASWNAEMDGDDLETRNFESYNVGDAASYDEGIVGFIKCTLDFGGDWDAGVNPLGSPPGLYPRDDLAALSFYTSRVDAVLWSFTYARIRKAKNSGEVKGKVLFTSSGFNQGRFIFPTSSV